MVRILISACLAGELVRYDGSSVPVEHALLTMWRADGRLVPFCPELAAGLSVPREPCEIVDARVVTPAGADLTAAFERGADLALAEALRASARIAILKSGSPSCGSGWIYDGTFTHTRRAGNGVTAARLLAHGIEVFDEFQIEDAAVALERLHHGEAV